MTWLLVVLGVAVLLPLAAVIRGWALNVLWGWFVVPVFHLPELPIAAAIGITAIFGMLTYSGMQPEPKAEEDDAVGHFAGVCIGLLIGPLVVVAFGALVKQWM